MRSPRCRAVLHTFRRLVRRLACHSTPPAAPSTTPLATAGSTLGAARKRLLGGAARLTVLGKVRGAQPCVAHVCPGVRQRAHDALAVLAARHLAKPAARERSGFKTVVVLGDRLLQGQRDDAVKLAVLANSMNETEIVALMTREWCAHDVN